MNMKENNKKSVLLNLIQDLRRLSLQLINNLRGRFQIKFGMTPCVKGFTLIELLVVVLIIGVLTAIALSAYQRTILKTHYASGKHIVRSLGEAQEVYYLTHGRYASTVDELDVQLSGAPEIKEGYPSSFLVNGESCSLNNTNVSCTYKNIVYQLYYRHVRHAHAGLIRCVVLASPKQAPLETDICRRETGRTKASDTVNGGTRWNY